MIKQISLLHWIRNWIRYMLRKSSNNTTKQSWGKEDFSGSLRDGMTEEHMEENTGEDEIVKDDLHKNGQEDSYLADDCLAISAIACKRHLRSTHTGLLSVPRTTTMLGMRSFVVAGPVIWYSLPPLCEPQLSPL